MNNEFKREERYVVFKLSDLGNSLKGDEIRKLAREYAEQRLLRGKEPLECVVVEKDWPEYEPTWQAIKARVTGAQPTQKPEGDDFWDALKRHKKEKFDSARQQFLDKALADDDGGWTKHTDYHWSRMVNGERLDYWPSRKKFQWQGRVQRGDVMKIVRAAAAAVPETKP